MDPGEFERGCPFGLDDYQRRAIVYLDEDNSVLVSAPTGSGKTVVAEFACERSRDAGRKSFYTTPLKALSNQKFRDFSRVYPPGEVGLLTGDNSINGEAPLVVMTTEVLRNMIYERSPLLDTLGVVVLDECHYMHDPFRGAVWEEIIINLPVDVKLVALSATVSNAGEIGEWMNSLRGDVRVVVSDERPVELKNNYFVGRAVVDLFAKELHRVINDQLELMKKSQVAQSRRRRKGVDLRPRRVDVIKELEKRDMLPAIYFLFSRAACDDSVSMWLAEGHRLTSRDEERRITDYIREKASVLDRADLDCLGYREFSRALAAGVASHHAGELPLFKEAVEELFADGLIKVVFATETLSLGINMPARTVVIESLSKWVGDRHRPLTPGEYKQLTGRAGRRGIDKVGYAVVLHQAYFSVDHVRSLVKREPSPVVSSFQVSYNMVVNILAEHDLSEATRIVNLSFAQFEADRKVVTLEARLQSLEEELSMQLERSRCAPGGDACVYRGLVRDLAGMQRKVAGISKARRHQEVRDVFSRLRPGDVFLSGHREDSRVMAVVKKAQGGRGDKGLLVVDAAGRYRRIKEASLSHPPHVVGSVSVDKITSPTRKVRRGVWSRMELMGKGAGERVAIARSGEEEAIAQAIAAVEEELEVNPCQGCQHRERCVAAARRVESIGRQIRSLKKERDSGHDVVSRKLADLVTVLGRFGFLEGEKVTGKGEKLRRIYTECDLLLVEALQRGALSRLGPAELAALASWFIYESREGEGGRERSARGELEHLRGPLGEVLPELEELQVEMKRAEASEGLDLLGTLDTGFGEVAYAWAGGAELEDVFSLFPGSSVGDIVRSMKQIIDLLRQISGVADDPVLQGNLRKTMDLVDRGVVGYSSLESIIEMHEREEHGA